MPSADQQQERPKTEVLVARPLVAPLPATYLQPAERPLLDVRRVKLSWIDVLLGQLVVLGILVAATAWFALHRSPLFWAALAFVSLAGVVFLVLSYRRVATTRYILTADRVYSAHGRLVFHLAQATMDRVTDIRLHQSFWGRRFGFGTIVFETAGHGVQFLGVADPETVKRQVEEARVALIDRLIGDHVADQDVRRASVDAPPATSAWRPVPRQETIPGAQHGAADPAPSPAPQAGYAAPAVGTHVPRAPRTRGKDAVAWQGRPAPLVALGFILPAVLPLLMAAIVGATFARESQPLFGILALLFLLVFGGSFAYRAWVLVRHTHYEIRTKGVSVEQGFLTRNRSETTFEKVTDVSVEEGVFGRIFGFGTIQINTAGSNTAAVVFQGVPDPRSVKAILDELRDSERSNA